MRIAVSMAIIALLVVTLPAAVASAQASDRQRAIDIALDYEPMQDAVPEGPGMVFLGESSLRLFFDSTLLNQEGSGGYGSSHFGFWGQFQSLAFLKRLVLVLYLASCLLLGLWPRRLDLRGFLYLTAAVVLGTQLWKTHAGGIYMGWFVPFLVLAFLLPMRSSPAGQKATPAIERAGGLRRK